MHRYAFALLIILPACAREPIGAAPLATYGDLGDGDPCTPDPSTFEGGPCSEGLACALCDVALYGTWECGCAHDGADGCEVDADCPAGKVCDGFGDCRTPCTSDADCASGEACPQEGLCIATASCAPTVCIPLSDACSDAACGPAECASLPVCGG